MRWSMRLVPCLVGFVTTFVRLKTFNGSMYCCRTEDSERVCLYHRILLQDRPKCCLCATGWFQMFATMLLLKQYLSLVGILCQVDMSDFCSYPCSMSMLNVDTYSIDIFPDFVFFDGLFDMNSNTTSSSIFPVSIFKLVSGNLNIVDHFVIIL